MKLFLISTLSLLIISCQNKEKSKHISAIKINREITGLYPHYARLYFSDDLIITQETAPFITSTSVDGVETVRSSPTKYNTIIFSNHSQNAIFCDSADLRTARVVNKDSILRNEWAFSKNMDSVLNKSVLKKMSVTRTNEGNTLEKYLVTNKADTTLKNTYFLEYSTNDFLTVPYTLSSALENKKGLKLVRYTLQCDSSKRCEDAPAGYVMEMTCKLTPLEIDNPKEIQALFDYARKHLK